MAYRPVDWMDDALCAQIGGDVMFPEHGSQGKPQKEICGRCSVRAECLEWALQFPQDRMTGVWGGETASGMRKVRAERALGGKSVA